MTAKGAAPEALDISAASEAFPGSGSLRFEGGKVAGKKPVTVHYHRPADLPDDAPVVFVMHGTKRDGDHYRDNWRAASERFRFLLLCPQFDKDHYNRRAYHLGHITHRSGEPQRKSGWTFNAIEDLFDFIREETGNTSEKYHIYGHSAGGQFVHRMVMFMPEARFETAVAANSGWYTMPDFDREYPYGLEHAPNSPETLTKAFGRELVILLGERDTDPKDPYLRNSSEVVEQGKNRLERGRNFHAAARERAAETGAAFRWKLRVASDAPHLDAAMMPAAARAMFPNSDRLGQ